MTVSTTPELGTEALTEHLMSFPDSRSRQAVIDFAVARAEFANLHKLLVGLNTAMIEVEDDMLTETGKAGARGRASAYADAARLVQKVLDRL